MAFYPNSPLPSSVSAPALIRPMLQFAADSGYEVRRALSSRQRFRYTLEYLGKTTYEMRALRDFLSIHGNGITPFQWLHLTAADIVPVIPSTPVFLSYTHGLATGQWVYISSGPPTLIGPWQITRLDTNNLALNGSVSVGTSTASVAVYLPNAVARFDQNLWESPAKLIGPERLAATNVYPGFFSWSVDVEEVF